MIYSFLQKLLFVLLLIINPTNNEVFAYDKIKTELFTASINNRFNEMNIILEQLEDDIDSGTYKQACINSKKALKIINKNIKAFKKIEPYYNWTEIKKVILRTSTEQCNKEL